MPPSLGPFAWVWIVCSSSFLIKILHYCTGAGSTLIDRPKFGRSAKLLCWGSQRIEGAGLHISAQLDYMDRSTRANREHLFLC